MKSVALRGFAHASLVVLLGFSTVRAEDGSKVFLGGVKSAVLILSGSPEGLMQGSGSIVNLQQGYILTNWHVVHDGNGKAAVIFPLWDAKGRPIVDTDKYEKKIEKSTFLAKVVATDERCDLAIIKLLQPGKMPKGVASVRFASDSPTAGAKIYSIGNPGASGAMWVLSPGDVRSVYTKQWESGTPGRDRNGRKVMIKVGDHKAKIIEATSPTSPGDSGGPCFNDKCEQVGVTQGGKDASVAQGYSYFIDSSEVKAFLKKNKIAYNVVNDTQPESTEPMTVKKDTDPPKNDTVAAKDPEPKKNVSAADADLADQEKRASSRLNLIRPLANNPGKKSFVTEQLKKIISMYPKTEAAKEAMQLLKKVE
jgi:hypothetical protein